MSSTSLVVMAAGLGSRFGGTKQLVDVGPGGEAFLDYAIRDAADAGIDRVVMIIRTDLEADVRSHLDAIHGDSLDVEYVFQDTFGPPRDKPWGTGHAILAAKDAIEGSFVVLNADDYYGPSSYRLVADGLVGADRDEAILVGFELGRTLPTAGAVSRGVCEVVDGALVAITETHGIARTAEGIRAEDPPGVLAEDTPVSMNLWGFPKQVVEALDEQWEHFYAANADEPKAEFLLPSAVAEQMRHGLSVTVARSSEDWIGVTNPDDLEPARAAMRARS